jgi:CspA family cold shock protein
MTGKVKWFNNDKGYGFIECPNLDDIFVHYSAIRVEGYKTLASGDVVNFKLIETVKGLQALDVTQTSNVYSV